MSIANPPRILGNRLLVRPLPNQTPAGLVIPETVQARSDYAQIVRLGNGAKIPRELAVGQTLRIDTEHGAQDVWIAGVRHQIVSIYDTLAIVG